MAARIRTRVWLPELVICVLFASPACAKTIYVDDSAAGRDNGVNWTDAFTHLSSALAQVRSNDEIRVAQGLYRPTIPGGDREESFLLVQASGAKIRGGYAGVGAPDPDARDPNAYETILSGDLNGDDGPGGQNNGENCYHVFTSTGVDRSTVLEGFTIKAGNANDVNPEHQNGSGMLNDGGSPTIIDCCFTGNAAEHAGGAIFNNNGNPKLVRCRFSANSAKYGGAIHSIGSRPVMLYCTFTQNQASHGGGLYLHDSHAELTSCAFYGNSAGYGGGMLNHLSDPNVVNCLFSGNFATRGGGLFNYGSRPALVNCTLSRNSASFGGGMYDVEAVPVLVNDILWGNSSAKGKDEEAQIYMDGGDLTVSYCCIQGWTGRRAGSGNTYLDPLFVDDDGKDGTVGTEDDDLRLLRTSPCIDTGDSNAVPSDLVDLDGDGDVEERISSDQAGNPRIWNGVVDRGAFEFYQVFFPGPVIYVDGSAATPGDGRNWSTALTSLQKALQIASEYHVVREIRVAAGVYTPAEPKGPRAATFQLISNVAIRGGYAGQGQPDPNGSGPVVDPNTRDLQAYETILSGDLNHDDAGVDDPCDLLAEPTRSDNSCHVVTGSGTDVTAIFDGFTITGGMANGMYDEDGGGIYIMAGSPTILQCTFRGNAALSDGGGIYCLFGDPNVHACTISGNCAGLGGGVCCVASSPSILENTVTDNYAVGNGAGIVCDYLSSPLIAKNTIRGNKTHEHGGGICCLGGSAPRIQYNAMIANMSHDGGGVYCLGSHPSITNNMIFENTVEDDGGGICAVEDSCPTIRNNTIARNRANPQGGGIYLENAQATVTNCILWDNGDDFHNCTPVYDCNATYSCIEDGNPGKGNIFAHPHFRDPQNGDYHLKPYSPCIDAGNTAPGVLPPDETDFDGDPRVHFQLSVDIGADETQFCRRVFDKDKNGLPDAWEEEYFEGAHASAEDDPDDDGYSNRAEYERGTNPHAVQRTTVYVSSVSNNNPRPDGSREHPLTSIQQAIEEVRERGEILVTAGTFHERLTIDGKILSLQGGYDPNFTRIEHYTVLSADRQGRGVLYINVPEGTLSGFIITDGLEVDGGGMYFLNSSPTIRDNIIMNNATVDDGGGASFYFGSAPLFEDNIIADNCSGDNAAGIYCREANPIIQGCLITGNMAEDGGAMRLRNASPSILDCVITDNVASDEGGAIVCREAASPLIDGCTICNNYAGGKGAGIALSEGSYATIRNSILRGNVRQAVWANQGTIQIEGVVETLGSDWSARDLILTGEGELHVGPKDRLRMDNCSLQCDLIGQPSIQVALESELVIEKDARVDLGHPTNPQENGDIQCDGLLHVRNSAYLTGATVRVTRASFEGDVDITHSIIRAEAGVPYGQFFVADTVRITDSEIHADGDRYIDLDPRVFAGLIENNKIYVNITEGIGKTRGGLFELRGAPDLVTPTSCDPNVTMLCKVDDVPGFALQSWTLEELWLAPGAKLNLTNRFDFQFPFDQDGSDEVLYVRNLHLSENSVLNTCFNRICYKELTIEPNATVTSVPLLGFSLNNIAFDNENEFLTRIQHNNVIDSEEPRRIHVAWVSGDEPPPNKAMRMSCLEDANPKSSTFGQTISARAKGLFAKSNEPQIQIRFEYLFCDPAETGELVIYLTDIPELLTPDDPNRALYYVEVGRVLHPPAGRPGSADSDLWSVFEQVVSVQHMNFRRGTRIELELVGPAGACVLIDNWDPAIRCLHYCGDVAGGNHSIDQIDFLAVLAECGHRIDEVDTPGATGTWCLEGFFCNDGYVTIHDAMAVDWINKTGNSICPRESPVGDLTSAAYVDAPAAMTPASTRRIAASSAIQPLQDLRGRFLVAAKRYEQREYDFLSDRLYGLDANGAVVDEPRAMANDRLNGKLVRDRNGTLYQVNLELGLVGVADNQPIVAPGILSIPREPRMGLPAEVYIGFQEADGDSWGYPVLDAAFDAAFGAEGCVYVYVVPVVVAPALGAPYIATAKLKLDGETQNSDYSIECLLYDPLDPADNLDPNHLREVEVDQAGNVYVLNCHSLNNSDILWVYDSFGGIVARQELQDLGISAPVGLCVSSREASTLYLASSESEPNADSVELYVLSLSSPNLSLSRRIEIRNMGHITDIAEDPTDGTVCVVGFLMQDIPCQSEFQDGGTMLSEEPFYQPRLAVIHAGDAGPIKAMCPTDGASPVDMRLPVSVVYAEEASASHNAAR